jgi:two-component sensor histidine kinase
MCPRFGVRQQHGSTGHARLPTPALVAMRLTVTVSPDPKGPADARRFVRGLTELSAQVRHDLELVVSELVTNSVKYGPPMPITVHLDIASPDLVRGEVVDQGRAGQGPKQRTPSEAGGYGLLLVERLCERWGVTEGSTHVWFELGG